METQECFLFIVVPDTVRHCQQYEIHLTLHGSARYFFPDFNQIWIFSTDSHESQIYQISQKSDQWEPRWHNRTDGQKKGRMDVKNET